MKKIIRIFSWILGSILLLFVALIVIFHIDLSINGWNIKKRFGNNYALTSISSTSYIMLYCIDKACDYSYCIIRDNIISYNYNKNWIIARSDNDNYWIIDKTIPIDLKDSINPEPEKAGLIGPLDSLEFYKNLDKYDIKLKLKDRR